MPKSHEVTGRHGANVVPFVLLTVLFERITVILSGNQHASNFGIIPFAVAAAVCRLLDLQLVTYLDSI